MLTIITRIRMKIIQLDMGLVVSSQLSGGANLCFHPYRSGVTLVGGVCNPDLSDLAFSAQNFRYDSMP